jgi:hypothetical protein
MCQAHRPQPSADYLSLLGATTFGECSILGQQGKEAETGRLGVLRLRHLSRSRLRYMLRAGASRRSSLACRPRPSSTWAKASWRRTGVSEGPDQRSSGKISFSKNRKKPLLVGTDLVHVDLGVSHAVAAGPAFVTGAHRAPNTHRGHSHGKIAGSALGSSTLGR